LGFPDSWRTFLRRAETISGASLLRIAARNCAQQPSGEIIGASAEIARHGGSTLVGKVEH